MQRLFTFIFNARVWGWTTFQLTAALPKKLGGGGGDYHPQSGVSEKLKKCGESMVQGQLSLKVGVGGITLLFAKLRYAFEEKLFFLPS